MNKEIADLSNEISQSRKEKYFLQVKEDAKERGWTYEKALEQECLWLHMTKNTREVDLLSFAIKECYLNKDKRVSSLIKAIKMILNSWKYDEVNLSKFSIPKYQRIIEDFEAFLKTEI